MAHIGQSLGPDDCWPWDGTIHYKGYGLLHGGKKAHRETYRKMVGPIPGRLVVDHDCHNRDGVCADGNACRHRRCVNPKHLVLRSRKDNTTVGFATRAKCPNGHDRTPANRTRRKNGDTCTLCLRDSRLQHKRAARRAAGMRERRDGFCLNGHAWTAENTYVAPKSGKRACIRCRKDREQAPAVPSSR